MIDPLFSIKTIDTILLECRSNVNGVSSNEYIDRKVNEMRTLAPVLGFFGSRIANQLKLIADTSLSINDIDKLFDFMEIFSPKYSLNLSTAISQ